MKKLCLLLFSLTFSLSVFAYDHFYSVDGINQNGDLLEGGIFNINDDGYLRGNLVDTNGDSHSFQGEFSGNGRMRGETDDGDTVYLNVEEGHCCKQY